MKDTKWRVFMEDSIGDYNLNIESVGKKVAMKEICDYTEAYMMFQNLKASEESRCFFVAQPILGNDEYVKLIKPINQYLVKVESSTIVEVESTEENLYCGYVLDTRYSPMIDILEVPTVMLDDLALLRLSCIVEDFLKYLYKEDSEPMGLTLNDGRLILWDDDSAEVLEEDSKTKDRKRFGWKDSKESVLNVLFNIKIIDLQRMTF